MGEIMEYRFLSRLVASLTSLAVLACSQDAISEPRNLGEAESVTPDAQGLFPVANSLTKNERSTSLAFDGTNFMVGFLSEPVGTGAGIVKARTVSAAGVVGGVISTGRTSDQPPLVSFDGTNYLLVWHDITNAAAPNLRGQFLNPGGVKVGPIITITHTDNIDALDGLAFGGGQYLVTFNRTDGNRYHWMYRKFVSPNGAVGSARPLDSSPAWSDRDGFSNLATDGTDFLAVWSRPSLITSIMAELVRGDGSIGSLNTVGSGGYYSRAVTAGFAGGNYQVVWTGRDYRTQVSAVRGRPVSAAGVATGSVFYIASGIVSGSVVVTTGGNVAVEFNRYAGPDIMLRFMDASGTLLGTEKTLFSSSSKGTPGPGPLFANGSDFFLVLNRTGPNSLDVLGNFKTVTP
jgi:hypothetical protein